MLNNVDFRSVQWGRTIMLNTMRAFSAGLVWGVFALFSTGSFASLVGIPIIMAAGYVMFLPFYFLTCKIMNAVAGDFGQMGVNILTIILALAISVGDPAIYFLHREKPHLVPLEVYKPFNVTMVLYVMDPASA